MIRIVTRRLGIEPMGETQIVKSSQRIANAFLELLEQQFPIVDQHPMRLRYPSQFADKLNIHVNYLNKVVKETQNKTTTQVISERILQEAKILLRTSKLTVAEIAYILGFTESTHFNNFFRKHAQINPTKFRAG